MGAAYEQEVKPPTQTASGTGGERGRDEAPGGTPGLPPAQRLRWARLVLGAAAGVAGAVVAVVLFRPGLVAELRASGLGVREPSFLVLAGLAAAFAYTCDALTLILLVRRVAPCIARRQVAAISLEGTMIGGVSSFGGLEVPYKVVMLRQAGVPGALATSAIVLKGLVRVTPLAVVGLLALLPGSASPLDDAQRTGVVAVAVLFVAMWAAGWYLARRPHHAGLLPGWLRHRARAALVALRSYRRAGVGFWLRIALLQAGYWLGMFTVIPMSLYALGWRGDVAPVVVGQAVVQLLMPLSPLPGGAAVAEVTYLAVVAPTATDATRAASLVFWRLFTWVLPVGLGLVVLAVRQAQRGRPSGSIPGPPTQRSAIS